MIDSLRAVVDFLTSVVSFGYHTLTSIFNLISQIPTYVSFLSVSIGLLPTVLIPFAIASISLYGVLFLLNRE